MFNKNFDLNKHIEEEKLKAEEEAKKEREEKEKIELAKAEEEKNKEIKKMTDKKDNKIKSNKKGIKNLVEMYLAKNNIKYNDWLAEKHQELLNEMIENDMLIIKGDNK